VKTRLSTKSGQPEKQWDKANKSQLMGTKLTA